MDKTSMKLKLLHKILGKRKNRDSDSDDDDVNIEENDETKMVYISNNDIYFKMDVTLKSVDKLMKIIKDCNEKFALLKKDKSIKEIVPNPLNLHITSYGGCAMSGLMAADVIEQSNIPIHTIVEGYAASAATFMSIVGKKRYITKRSQMLIHQIRTYGDHKFGETFEEQRDDYLNSKHLMEEIVNLYRKYTKLTKIQIENELKHDLWRNSKSCLESKLIDEIIY